MTALVPVPFSAMSAIIAGVSSAFMVTSMPTSLIFASDRSTRRAGLRIVPDVGVGHRARDVGLSLLSPASGLEYHGGK